MSLHSQFRRTGMAFGDQHKGFPKLVGQAWRVAKLARGAWESSKLEQG